MASWLPERGYSGGLILAITSHNFVSRPRFLVYVVHFQPGLLPASHGRGMVPDATLEILVHHRTSSGTTYGAKVERILSDALMSAGNRPCCCRPHVALQRSWTIFAGFCGKQVPRQYAACGIIMHAGPPSIHGRACPGACPSRAGDGPSIRGVSYLRDFCSSQWNKSTVRDKQRIWLANSYKGQIPQTAASRRSAPASEPHQYKAAQGQLTPYLTVDLECFPSVVRAALDKPTCGVGEGVTLHSS